MSSHFLACGFLPGISKPALIFPHAFLFVPGD